MSPGTLGFLAPILPPRKPLFRGVCKSHSIVASQDQWEQYEALSKDAKAHQLKVVRAVPTRDLHHQIFVTKASKSALTAASKRFMDSFHNQYAKHRNRELSEKRLWILEAIADDTFGILRGAPEPPRFVAMESFDSSGNGERAQKETNSVVSRWTSALNRAGKALSSFKSYCVEYAVWGGASCFGSFHQLQPGYLVACEVLNADWTDSMATENMRKMLLSYAQEAVDSGRVLMYQVLQSVDEPTMFKTVETYACLDDLREHMESLDPEFAKNAMQYRAAVNRVRQLHRCTESLHNLSKD